jgi:hypothetical protein
MVSVMVDVDGMVVRGCVWDVGVRGDVDRR